MEVRKTGWVRAREGERILALMERNGRKQCLILECRGESKTKCYDLVNEMLEFAYLGHLVIYIREREGGFSLFSSSLFDGVLEW